MKKEALLICLLSFLFLPLCAQEYLPIAKKYYCQVDQIEITNEMILVHVNGDTFELGSLMVDQGGIYYTEDTLRCTYCRRPVNPKRICDCTN